jgi:hypothetical protein
VADDACSAVKSDLQAGSFTNYTDSFPIYIENVDDFQGGNVYIVLRAPWRETEQTVNGTVLYTKRGCTILIVANSATIRDQLFDDLENILPATGRGYKLKKGKDNHRNKNLFDLPLEVEMLL